MKIKNITSSSSGFETALCMAYSTGKFFSPDAIMDFDILDGLPDFSDVDFADFIATKIDLDEEVEEEFYEQ